MLSELGYVTLRFDMRGCGDSEGEFGRVICLEQVEDTRNALTFLAQHPAVDPERIAVIGSSFGGAVAVYAGGVDERVAAVISNGGWGDGERKFRGQHKSPEEWARFTKMLEEGREHRAKTGKSLMVPRYDIVPIPPHLREQSRQELDRDVSGRDRAEHVRLPRRRRGRQDRAAAAAADPRRERFGDADRAVGRAVQARRAAGRAASVQRGRPFPVRGGQRAGVGRDARLAAASISRHAREAAVDSTAHRKPCPEPSDVERQFWRCSIALAIPGAAARRVRRRTIPRKRHQDHRAQSARRRRRHQRAADQRRS